MSDTAFNKHTTHKPNGTLIANWQEERALRDFNGVGRTIVKEHIPKKHLDFENPITNGKQFDNTKNRICGETRDELMRPTCLDYGTGRNPADLLPKAGKKNGLLEQAIADQVAEEMRQRQAAIDLQSQQRSFHTTNKATFHGMHSLAENVVGRKVMKTQDGKMVSMNDRDQQLIVETQMWRRQQKLSDNECAARVPVGDYTQTRPVTIYTEALERKNTYMSASTGPNPFAITRGFTQPLDKTKAVLSYEGNIDFDKEKRTVDTMRTSGRDLYARNPYNEKTVHMSNFAQIRAELVAACAKKANGLRALRLLFKQFDKDGNGTLDPKEFRDALASFGIPLVELEVAQCLKYFDKNNDGKLSFTEFLGAVHGDLPPARREAVHQAFFKVDPHMSGQTTLRALENQYVAADEIDKQDFLDAWGTTDKNAKITLEDFESYYQDISAHESNDGIFMANLRVAWRM